MKNIFPYRLRSARKMAGLSMQNLADNMDNLVSKQAINKYEKGSMLPDSKVLIKLAEVLNVKVDFFFRDPTVNLENINFRKRSKLSVKEESSIKEKAIDFLERYIEIENLLGINASFVFPVKKRKISSHKDVENIALELRNAWDLGLNPIPNVIEMLEERGVKVYELSAPEAFDGLSSWVEDIPVIVINKNYDPIRKRFTVLHELGHLLLDFEKNEENKKLEKFCHAFAGAFLIPKTVFIREFGEHRTRISIPELIDVKEYFGISVQALMMRAQALNVLPESKIKEFFIMVRSYGLQDEKGWGEYKGKEESSHFSKLVYRAASEEIISLSKAAALNNISLSEFRTQFEKV
jgi:Zn-dependent peptidase ImmA (M78 family)/DNA-binding XRE family transcriptional regulator